MANVSSIGNATYGITFGDETLNVPTIPLRIGTLDHVLAANNGEAGIRVLSNQSNDAPGWTLSHSTLYGNPVGLMMMPTNFASQAVTVTDSIIAAASGTGVQVLSTLINPVTVRNSGLVTAGPDALSTPTDDSVNTPAAIVLDASVVDVDPVFASTDPTSNSFVDVRSTAYGGQGTSASDLSGWGDYIGDFVGIEAWRQF